MDLTGAAYRPAEVLSAILRFRAISKRVIVNLSWLVDEDFISTPIKLIDSKAKKILMETNEQTVYHKLVFFKPPNQRTLFELESVKWMCAAGFKCFKLCLPEIQLALVRTATLKCYGPGRWILKEGHESKNMYLIIKGQVRVTQYVYNAASKVPELVEHRQLHANKSFGESAVMFDKRRITSIQSLSLVELISISKTDFLHIIKDNLQLQWDKNATAIRNSPYFKHLSPMELHKCSSVSLIQTFKQDEYVLGEKLGKVNYGHFVIQGRISLVHKINVSKSTDRKGKTHYKLINNAMRKSNKKKKFMTEYLEVCTFSENTCFNIGESIHHKEFIVFDIEDAVCLFVPHWFMIKTEKLKTWSYVKLDLNHIIPDEQEVFLTYVATRQNRKKENRN